jgi:hypothetical protein
MTTLRRPRRLIPAILCALGAAVVAGGIILMLEALSTAENINQRGCGGAACAYFAAQVEPGFIVFISGLVVWLIAILWAGWVALSPARTAQARWP